MEERSEKKYGSMRVKKNVGIGQGWMIESIKEFVEIYKDVKIKIIIDNEEMEMKMRNEECEVRMRKKKKKDIIKRRMLIVNMNVYDQEGYV